MRIEIQILVFMNDGVDKMKATEFLIVFEKIQEAMKTKSIRLVDTAEVGEVVTVVVDLEAGLENILVNSEVEEIAILQQEEISGMSIEDRIIVEEDTIVTIMDLLEDIEKIEVHSEEVFEVMIADIIGMIVILIEAMIILKKIEKDLFKAIEMKTMIKGTVMTEIHAGQEMNFGNKQEVLEDPVHLEVVAINLKEVIMHKKVDQVMMKTRLVATEVVEAVVNSEADFENFVVDSEVGEIVAQQEEISGAIADQIVEEVTETIVDLLVDIGKIVVHPVTV